MARSAPGNVIRVTVDAATVAAAVAEVQQLPTSVQDALQHAGSLVLEFVLQQAAIGLHLLDDPRIALMVVLALWPVLHVAMKGDVESPI